MTDPTRPAELDAAAAYEQTLVPALMREWAPRLVAAAEVAPANRVLDVACGTGILARTAAAIVGPSGRVTGLDLARGMLRTAAATSPGVSWCQASAGDLPFPDATFDAVVSQFGLMFFPDRPRALGEMWRVLKPGGRMAVAVWASLDDTPAYAAEVALVERLAGAEAAAVLRLPFVLGDRPVFEALFREAGIDLESVSTPAGTGRFASIREMIETDLVGWLPLMGMRLDPVTVERVVTDAESLLKEYLTPDGSVRFASPAHVAVAARSAAS